MADLALASCSSPLPASDLWNWGSRRTGDRFRAGIVHNCVSVSASSQISKFWIDCFGSRKIPVRGRELRRSECITSSVSCGIGGSNISKRIPFGDGVCGKNMLCGGYINAIGFLDFGWFDFDAVCVSLSPRTTFWKFSAKVERVQCLQRRAATHYFVNVSCFAKSEGFEHRNYEMMIGRKRRGIRQTETIPNSSLNRWQQGDVDAWEDENYDYLDDAFRTKFKRNGDGNKNKLLDEDEESSNSNAADSFINTRPEISSTASNGKRQNLGSEVQIRGRQIDQRGEGYPIHNNSLPAKDGSLLMDRDLLELRREIQGEDGLENSERGKLVGESMNEVRLNGGESENLVTPDQCPGRQALRRSHILAKQVISIQSASSLGFVSQLWVDARSWAVVVVEVRPSLLSGEIERFLLKDVCQVGDVVLVQDENVIGNDLRLIGLETLVGYNVVTESRRTLGKVRGYTFDIESGTIESLELDSFGISVIPSSLVSTYCLFVEDVLEVLSDTIIVEDGAASRLQRLSKGFWGNQRVKYVHDEYEDEFSIRSMRRQSGSRRSGSRRFLSRMQEREDWDLPMDY